MVRSGLLATAALLLGMGLLHGFTPWGALRAAAGVVSAWVFVFASGWGLRRLAETHSPTLAGVIYTGIGIAVTGLLGGVTGRWGSDAAWIGYGLLALLLIALIWRVFDDGAAASAGAGRAPEAPPLEPSAHHRSDARWLVGLYGLAGFGYIITATFLPVIARQALPGSPWPRFLLAAVWAGHRARRVDRCPRARPMGQPAPPGHRLRAAGGRRRAVGAVAEHCRFRGGQPAAGHAIHRNHPVRGAGSTPAARQCGGRIDRLRHGVLRRRPDPRATCSRPRWRSVPARLRFPCWWLQPLWHWVLCCFWWSGEKRECAPLLSRLKASLI
jgi:hypothetical protein